MISPENWYDREYGETCTTTNDPVHHPKHYTEGGVETIDYIHGKLSPDEWRGYIKGNVFKYLSRERHKGGLEDIRKAAWYLNKYLETTQEKDTANTVDAHTTSNTKLTGPSGTIAQKPPQQEQSCKEINKEAMIRQEELDERMVVATEKINNLLGTLLQQNDYMIKLRQMESNISADPESL